MENPEKTLMELNGFERAPNPAIPQSLEDYLGYIAKTGNTVFSWPKLKPLMKMKLETTITEFHESLPEEQGIPKMPNVDVFKYSEMKERIFEQLESYSGVPFTVQRLCELLTQPKKHYKRVDKFMRGLEKVMLVVSTIDPFPLGGDDSLVHVGGGGGQNGVLGRKARELGGPPRELGGQSREVKQVGLGESPSKRIRLSSEEEAGPCDSQDGIQNGVSQEQDLTDNNEAGPSGCSGVSAAPLASPEPSEETETLMDIDTECTSSEARLALPLQEEGGVETQVGEGSSTQVGLACENGVVTTSEGSSVEAKEVEDAMVAEGVSDSTEGMETGAVEPLTELGDSCSSSDQQEERLSPDGEEDDSEAEPSLESREVVEEVESEVKEEEVGGDGVQSSEEREDTDRRQPDSESRGAADSSDDASVTSPVASLAPVVECGLQESVVDLQQPSCSSQGPAPGQEMEGGEEDPQASSLEDSEQQGEKEVASEPEVVTSAVQETKEEIENRPDQSDEIGQ